LRAAFASLSASISALSCSILSLQQSSFSLSEKAQQIKDYIESTKSILLSDGEDSDNETNINEQTLEPLQELDITDESLPQNTGLWNIWQSFEKLIGLLPSSGHHLGSQKKF